MLALEPRRPPGPPAASPAATGDGVAAAEQFRRSVALFATGIVVLSCECEDGGVHGMTVNSFTSISLDPPTVLVSLRHGRARREIDRCGRFGASILGEQQQDLSAHFSGRPEAALSPEFVIRHRVATLQRCLAWFECETVSAIEVHDHTLFISRVLACGADVGPPLMYFSSRYHRFSPAA